MKFGTIFLVVIFAAILFAGSIFLFLFILGISKESSNFSMNCERKMKNDLMIGYLLFNSSNKQTQDQQLHNNVDLHEKNYDFGNWNDENDEY